MAFKMKGPSLLKMTSALKQALLPMPIGASSALSVDQMGYGEQFGKPPSAEEIKLAQAKKKCNDNVNTEWKDGKCVNKQISENRTKPKSSAKTRQSASSGNFA